MKFALLHIIALAACACAFGKPYYVSSSGGSDSNDGSEAAPFKTIAAAPSENAEIFLKRGDVFYGAISGFKNCKIGAYGEGAKPVISGLKIVKNPAAWERLANDVWRIDLTKPENFEGYFAEGKRNNIGAVYDMAKDKVYGHLVRRYNALNAYGDFWVSGEVNRVNVQEKSENFRYLYFRSKENPSSGGAKIAFSTSGVGISNLENCEVDSVAVKGFGIHGVARAWGCKFRNMDVDLIGGSVQLGYPHWVRLGNGFEFWVSDKRPCSNNLVEGCTVSRTYDCGATIQGIGNGDMLIENVKFVGNTFIRCRQAFEHFVRSRKGTARYSDCEFSSNRSFEAGENEFSTPEARDAALLSYEGKPVSGLLIKDNFFWGSSVYSNQTHTAKMESNTFYVFRDQYLLFNRNKPEAAIFADSENAVEKMRAFLGNDTDKIFIADRGDFSLRDRIISEHFKGSEADIRRICKIPEKSLLESLRFW